MFQSPSKTHPLKLILISYSLEQAQAVRRYDSAKAQRQRYYAIIHVK